MRVLLDHARANRYGVPAFNVNNMEQAIAIMDAAAAKDAPVIIQASKGARKYAREKILRAIMLACEELYPKTPFAVHQDHGDSVATCVSAMDLAFTSVMIDGSFEPFEKNVEMSAEVVRLAHARGVTVEAELGHLGSLETGETVAEDGVGKTGAGDITKFLTDPEEAARFVVQTGVDALAVAIGTSHGAYKFKTKPSGKTLRIDRVKEIHERIPNVHLVMHGSSSVPEDLQAIFRQFGGEMPPTYGVPIEDIQEAIQLGVTKINVDTDLRLAWAGAVRKSFAEQPKEFDPRKHLGPATLAMQKVCEARLEQFGAAGNAGKIEAVSLDQMAERYELQIVT